MSFRHSKIVCTIGPATRSPKMIDRLLRAGMDVARLNFSHGSHEELMATSEAYQRIFARYEKENSGVSIQEPEAAPL